MRYAEPSHEMMASDENSDAIVADTVVVMVTSEANVSCAPLLQTRHIHTDGHKQQRNVWES